MKARLFSVVSLLTLSLSLVDLGSCVLLMECGGGGGYLHGKHTIYQGTATHGQAYPTLTLSVAIDTTANIWTAKWSGEGYILVPAPGIYSSFAIVFEDDKGFYQRFNSFEDGVSHNGVITITDYDNTGCWTHCWCRWSYAVPAPLGIGFIQLDLWVDLYTASEGHNTYTTRGGSMCRAKVLY